jgi:hypothetical protein
MKNILTVLIAVLLVLPVFGNDSPKATVLEIDARERCVNYEEDNNGIMCQLVYNNETYLYAMDNITGSVLEIRLDIESDNTVKLKGITDLYYDHYNNIYYHTPLGVCAFKNKFYLFGGFTYTSPEQITVYYKTPGVPGDDGKWGKEHSYKIENWTTNMPVAAVELDGIMYLYFINYHNLMCIKTEDGIDWGHDIWKVSNVGEDIDLSGNFSVSKIRDKDGESCMMIAYTSKDNKIKVGYHYPGSTWQWQEKASYKDDNLLKISSLQGSIHGGPSGNMVQIFYTTDKKDVYRNHKYFRRLQYDVKKEDFVEHKEFSQQYNYINNASWQPIVLSDYIEDGDGHLHKKIAVASPRVVCEKVNPWTFNKKQYLDILAWSSEKFEYQPADDTYDSQTDSTLWTIVGVMEGVPPFVLNGWNLNDDQTDPSNLPTYMRPVSSLSYGIFQSDTKSREFTFSCKNETEINFRGFLFGGGVFGEKSSKEEKTRTVSVDFKIEPTIDALGYWLVMKPTIYRKKYNILDGNGNHIDEFYIFKVSDNHLSLIALDDLNARSKLNPLNIDTYITRSYPFNRYNSVFKHAFSAVRGSDQHVKLEVSETEATKVTKGFNIKFGEDVEIPHIFKVKSVDTFEWKWTTEITQSSGQSVDIYTDIPDRNPNAGLKRDTTGYDGIFYWLTPTAGEDNWWIPKHSVFSDQKPWCMTWEVTNLEVEELGGIVVGVNENSNGNGLLIYPNPALNNTVIKFNTKSSTNTKISVYNSCGELVYRNNNSDLQIGENSVQLNTSEFAQGIYKCVVQNGGDIYSASFAVIR